MWNESCEKSLREKERERESERESERERREGDTRRGRGLMRKEGNIYSLSLHTDDGGASPDATDSASCHEVCRSPRARCHPPPSV